MSLLSRFFSTCAGIFLLTRIACRLSSRNQVLPYAGRSCMLTQQPQDDATVLLQGGRIHVERLSEHDIDEQIQQGEPKLQAFSLLPPMQEGTATIMLASSLKDLKNSLLSVLSMPAIHQVRSVHVLGLAVGLLITMCLGIAFCISVLSLRRARRAAVRKEERPSPLYSNDMMRHSQDSTSSWLSSSVLASPGVANPGIGSGGAFMGMRVGTSPNLSNFQWKPFRTDQSLPSKRPAQGQPAMPVARALPPALCQFMVFPVCEARLVVPMRQIVQLRSEGELDILGLSGTPLLRATVRRVGRQRSLEISMPDVDSQPRARIGPSLSSAHSDDSTRLEIRGLKGAFYGMLEMPPSGAPSVKRRNAYHEETTMIIDGDTDSLQLVIKSGGGMHLASVSHLTELLEGTGNCGYMPASIWNNVDVDYVELRVEPGVDTVLVCACVLSVLLLSPNS